MPKLVGTLIELATHSPQWLGRCASDTSLRPIAIAGDLKGSSRVRQG